MPQFELPPNQHLAAPGKWPLVGEREPPSILEPWTIRVVGNVTSPCSWTLQELKELPQVEQSIDIHCVTRWSQLGAVFRGVLLREVVARVVPLPTANFVSFVAHSNRNHSTSLPLRDSIELKAMLAFECNGGDLPVEHGGPVRVIVPNRYFYKSVKWLECIELHEEDRLGYWERVAGYHNHADPWREERYMAPALDRQTTARAIAQRNFEKLDLRSIAADSRNLSGLNARNAILRDADFRHATLMAACFDAANLSNAHFEYADLRDASFLDADVEGANFAGADLRGADLRGASLFGATFVIESPTLIPANINCTTRMDLAAIEQLAPLQQEFVLRFMRDS